MRKFVVWLFLTVLGMVGSFVLARVSPTPPSKKKRRSYRKALRKQAKKVPTKSAKKR